MSTLHLVSHTHWDREWYLPFQVFRLKLVHLIDGLLELLARTPDYRYYMLDGQTVVLDDYLQMRPERAAEIRALVQNGRLLIGPWHVLADEFLVSPESLIRNLLQGDRTARCFGPKMPVGYTPDPFGHIGQLPQILAGFGIDAAVLMRGLADEPAELWWEAPDGSRVLLAFLRDGYGNAAGLPVAAATGDETTRALFLGEVARLRDSLAPHSATGQLLLMQGTDHMEPQPATAAAIACAREHLGGDTLIHSTLPAYLAAVRPALQANEDRIPTVRGELRNPARFPLLPGVLSTRMWIKQRNYACETLLEKWAEPFSAWAALLPGAAQPGNLSDTTPILRQAWRLLMECHPHDSICGCSIDQVHDEMRPRFDQVEQIGEQITHQALAALAAAIDTRPAPAVAGSSAAIVVFNPLAYSQTGTVQVITQLPGGSGPFSIVDETGVAVPLRVLGVETTQVANEVLDREGLMRTLGGAQAGSVGSLALLDLELRRAGPAVQVEARLGEAAEPNYEALGRALAILPQLMADPTLNTFILHAFTVATTVELLARDVPGHGYRTFWLKAGAPSAAGPAAPAGAGDSIANEYFTVTANPADGTLTLADRRTGQIYEGLNCLVDGGDCGDEYNYCPPASDRLLSADGATLPGGVQIRRHTAGIAEALEITYTLPAPAAISDDRRARTGEAPLGVRIIASLTPGVARLDIVTEIANQAHDHRLRAHFPAPFAVDAGDFDGHFAVVRRPVGVPPYDATWVEQPRPEAPQRAWTDVSNGRHGLMVAAKGLPEVEVMANGEIALTLLRCVGWLSRDDLSTRHGHAGPGLPTPGAQMPGRHRFEYAVIPHADDWRTSGAYREGYAFSAPLRGLAVPMSEGTLPPAGSLLSIAPATFLLSAVKAADDGHGVIVRGYNIGERPAEVQLRPWRPFAHAWRVRLDETGEDALAVGPDGSVTFTAGPAQVVTVRLV